MPNSPASGRAALVPWMVVGAVWVTLAIASGLYLSFPVFFVALLEEFGWSRGATAAAFSIWSIVQGTLALVVGILVDRVGPRRVMLGGACLLSGACVLSSQIGSLWTLYVVTGELGASGLTAVSWVPSGGRSSASGEVGDALRTRAFWALFFAYLRTPLAVFSLVTHQVAFAVDQGFPRLFVAGIFGLTGLLSTVGRIVFGIAADRIGRATSATISYGCTAEGTLCLLGLEVWPHAAALYAHALFLGLGFGARGPIITAMASQLFPGRRFGVIYGMLSVGNGIGGGIAPWFGGVVHDLTGSYRIAFLIAVGFCVLGAVCFRLARPRRRRP